VTTYRSDIQETGLLDTCKWVVSKRR